MPIKRFLLLLILISPLNTALAAWTGISAFGGEIHRDWSLNNSPRVAEAFVYGLSIEEKTKPGLRIGLAGGRFSLDVESIGQTVRDEYDGEFLQLYLRWPFALSEHFSFHVRFDYGINHGDHEDPANDSEIEWSERSLTTGLAFQTDVLTLQPFVRLSSVEGDVENGQNGLSFESTDSKSYGLILDLHVERTAFVRLRSEFAAVESLQIHFIRGF